MIAVALSLRQPWAWLVVHGGKNIENRRWSTRRRGFFFVHAAKGMTQDEYNDAVDFAWRVDPSIAIPRRELLAFGGIIGRARIVDVVSPGSKAAPWHMPEQFGFMLADVEPLPFRAMRGALGFFRVAPLLGA